MNLSREDMFCEAQQTTTTAAASANALDFHAHGDDVMGGLYWSVHVAGTTGTVDKALTVAWETSDAADFGTASTVWSKAVPASELASGSYPVRNEPLPKGLKRYNRLKFTSGASSTAYPKVTAFIHAGRDEGTPFRG